MGLRVPEARDQPAIHDGEDGALGLHGGIRSLIQDASHLTVALGAAMTVVLAHALVGARAAPIQEARCLSEGNVAAVAPTSAMICCAESTPNPGTSASRWTAS